MSPIVSQKMDNLRGNTKIVLHLRMQGKWKSIDTKVGNLENDIIFAKLQQKKSFKVTKSSKNLFLPTLQLALYDYCNHILIRFWTWL